MIRHLGAIWVTLVILAILEIGTLMVLVGP